MKRRYPPPQCVGCLKRSTTCRPMLPGMVCRTCRPLLRQVERWANEAHRLRPSPQEPAAVERGRGIDW